VLVSFNGDDGAHPIGALVLGSDGAFYGTTLQGGSNNKGTVFKVTTNGAFTSILSFNATNGAYPGTGLVLGTNGNLYGTAGSVFQVTTNGVLTTLASDDYGSSWWQRRAPADWYGFSRPLNSSRPHSLTFRRKFHGIE
jgi:uncharacterized repeat protein (TIGR03803 family)